MGFILLICLFFYLRDKLESKKTKAYRDHDRAIKKLHEYQGYMIRDGITSSGREDKLIAEAMRLSDVLSNQR